LNLGNSDTQIWPTPTINQKLNMLDSSI